MNVFLSQAEEAESYQNESKGSLLLCLIILMLCCVGWNPSLLDKTAARLLEKKRLTLNFFRFEYYLSEKEIESEEDYYIRRCFRIADLILSPCSNRYWKCLITFNISDSFTKKWHQDKLISQCR